jgi:hypothetical protein
MTYSPFTATSLAALCDEVVKIASEDRSGKPTFGSVVGTIAAGGIGTALGYGAADYAMLKSPGLRKFLTEPGGTAAKVILPIALGGAFILADRHRRHMHDAMFNIKRKKDTK